MVGYHALNKKKKALHISTYNSKNPPYARWFRELRPILDKDPHTKKLAEQVMFVTRQSKNLQRALTSSKVRKNTSEQPRSNFEQGAGSSKCPGCHACKVVKNKNSDTKNKLDSNSQNDIDRA